MNLVRCVGNRLYLGDGLERGTGELRVCSLSSSPQPNRLHSGVRVASGLAEEDETMSCNENLEKQIMQG